jgi:DNA-binding PadR family transcriptional regulator
MKKLQNDEVKKINPRGFLELYTLGYIIDKDKEVYGKEIIDYINDFNMSWRPSHGTFYPVLNDLQEHGLIEYVYEYDSRKFYAVTDYGKEYFRERADDFRKQLLRSAKFYKEVAEKLPMK